MSSKVKPSDIIASSKHVLKNASNAHQQLWPIQVEQQAPCKAIIYGLEMCEELDECHLRSFYGNEQHTPYMYL